MVLPRLLILSAYQPASPGVGGLLLADIARAWPQDRLCCFAFGGRPPATDEFEWLPTALGEGRPEKGYSRAKKRLARASSLPLRLAAWRRQAGRLVREAVRFAREQRVEKIWAVIDSLTNVLITRRVAEQLGVPYVTTVWDPPEYIAYSHGLDRMAAGWVMRQFDGMQRGAEACGVASQNMADEYGRLYGKRCSVMRRGVARRLWQPSRPALSDPERLVICFAGTLYARDEFDALVRAICLKHWRAAGRSVALRVLAPRVLLASREPANIEYLGYRSEEESMAQMNGADIGYLPYWFDPAYSKAVKLCFPAKLGAIMAAGRPVFFHGPRDSSVAAFLERYPAGFCCHSMDPAEIGAALEEFVGDPARYAAAVQAGRVAVETELDLQSYLSAFASLVGVGPSALEREDGQASAAAGAR